MTRLYKKSDYAAIKTWHGVSGTPCPTKDMLPEESCFIFEHPTKGPWLFVCIYLLNTQAFAIMEHGHKNPFITDDTTAAMTEFFAHIFSWLKQKDIPRAWFVTRHAALAARYEKFGWNIIDRGVLTMTRET